MKITIAHVLIAILIITVCITGYVIFLNRGWKVVYAPPKNDTLVILGDSLVEGVGATTGNDFVSVLGRKLGNDIKNYGVSGDTTAMGLARIDQVLNENPGVVFVLLGGNDVLKRVPIVETKKNLSEIIEILQNKEILVVLIGVRGSILRDRYGDMYKELAKEYRTAYVPDVLKGLLGNLDLMSDAIHPNDEGYRIIAEHIFKIVEPIVK